MPANEESIDQEWIAYITKEVKSASLKKLWGYQIRRKWSVREKPVAESPLADYEWKIITYYLKFNQALPFL